MRRRAQEGSRRLSIGELRHAQVISGRDLTTQGRYLPPMRIASLLASGTELCCALGAGDELVGRSHECDTPPWVERLPVLSRPTFDVTGPSAAIDRRVRELLRAGRPLYEVDEAALAALAPDVVITQTHCEVCAVGPEALACASPVARQRVVTFRGGTVEGVLEDFLAIARVLGRADAAERLVAGLRARMASWRQATEGLPRTRVACLEWTDPLFAMGNWGPELVALAGGESALGTAGAFSATAPWEALLAADPEVIVVAPCGFTLARALGEVPALAARPGWATLRAVRDGRVFAADGNTLFNRSSPGLWDTVDLLAEILHPDRFPPRLAGRAYQRV